MLLEQIRQLPKAELHCHLDGSVPMETLYEFADEQNIPREVMNKAVAPEVCNDLMDYLDGFSIIAQVLQTKEHLRKAAFAIIESVNKENVRYLELRFSPILHQELGLSVTEVIESVCQGIRDASKKFNVFVNLLICGIRRPYEGNNIDMLRAIEENNIPEIVGVDVAGDEAGFDNEYVEKFVAKARNNRMNITMHSGECGCAQNVLAAVYMGATRIGHGVAIKDDEKVMDAVKEKNVLLELCPKSNIQTKAISSWKEYPLNYFLENGIECCINTDNRTVSNTTLSEEFLLLFNHCNLNFETMEELTLNAINHSFATEDIKKLLVEEVENKYQERILNSEV